MPSITAASAPSRARGRRWGALVWALGLALLAPACSDDDGYGGGGADEDAAAADARAKAAELRRKAAEDEKKAAAAAEGDAQKIEYVYNPVARRDPFKSSLLDKDSTPPPIISDLQKYDLDQYKLVAIIWGGEGSVAMVEDPEGKGHFLRPGTLIGRNWGKVARITESTVVVAEEYRDFTGQLNVNEIVLNLPEASGLR